MRSVFDEYAELRRKGPVHRVPGPGGEDAWLVVGYHEVRTALADPTLTKDRDRAGAGRSVLGVHMLSSDPPQHTRLRKLVAREFTVRRVESLRPRVQAITDALLDDLVDRHEADLVDAFAFPLAITVICELIGVPFLDRAEFRRWSNEIVVAVDDADRTRHAQTMIGAYLERLIAAKRADLGDDLMSALIRADDLTPDELRATAFLLLAAGHETAVNLVVNGVLTLLRHPGQLRALRADWSLLDGAVEEILRYEGPLKLASRRFTTVPLDLGGVRIPGGGAPVLLALTSANRDDTRFPAPNTFDVHRTPGGHLAFGHGIHHCLGAPLARLEGRVALRSIFTRLPGLELGDADLVPLPSAVAHGVRHLPVRW